MLCGRWRAGELIRSVPPEVLPQLRAKVAAMEVLKGHRADIGLQRAWEGNYIALVSTSEEAVRAMAGTSRAGRVEIGKSIAWFLGRENRVDISSGNGFTWSQSLTPAALGVTFVNTKPSSSIPSSTEYKEQCRWLALQTARAGREVSVKLEF